MSVRTWDALYMLYNNCCYSLGFDSFTVTEMLGRPGYPGTAIYGRTSTPCMTRKDKMREGFVLDKFDKG